MKSLEKIKEEIKSKPDKLSRADRQTLVMMDETGYCFKCKELKPLDQFKPESEKELGIGANCIECDSSTVTLVEIPNDIKEDLPKVRDLLQQEAKIVGESQLKDGKKNQRTTKRTLGHVAEDGIYAEKISYCSSCKHFHLLDDVA